MSKYFEEFTGLYSLSKTIRFELIPQGKTLEKINEYGIISDDEHRAESYKKVKKLIDEYHKSYIQKTLQNAKLTGMDEYLDVYLKNPKDEKDQKRFVSCEADLRKQLKKILESGEEFKFLFSKELFSKLLPEYKLVRDNPDMKRLLAEFEGYTTYFKGFHENRRNMYTDEEKSTAIPFRMINQNLPKYVDNMICFKNFYENIDSSIYSNLESEINEESIRISEFFDIEGFNLVLTQEGIDKYNKFVGGFSLENGKKIKGINEYINEYNQVAKKNNVPKIGKLKPLFKIMLSERTSFSFVQDSFETDEEVFNALRSFNEMTAMPVEGIRVLAENIGNYNANKIYWDLRTITDLSKQMFGDWGYINAKRSEDYDKNYNGKITKTYEDKKEKFLKNQSSITLGKINEICSLEDKENKVENFISRKITELIDCVMVNRDICSECISKRNADAGALISDADTISGIKLYLDSMKNLQSFIKPFNGSNTENDKDSLFYGEFVPLYEELNILTALYNKVRNYLTKKPYTTEKIKLNFENQQLLEGWDLNKENDRKSVLLMKEDKYYLGIIRKTTKNPFKDLDNYEGEDAYEKMEYKLLPGANKMLPKVFFSASRKEQFNPPEEIIRIRETETFKKGENFSIEDCHKIIDFFKESINKHEDWSKFDFKFSPTSEYEDISGFYREVEAQGYKLSFKKISSERINELINEGDLFLFQIYNKDFSPYSKGTPNLHTLYWKALFDRDNLEDIVYKLNGEAEIFYRKSSISEKDKIVHPANQDIANKNPLNEKKSSNFDYDIVKDRRYTVDKFQFHVPLTLNFKAQGKDNINEMMRKYIKHSNDLHIIGIDRGERHLLYVSVIDLNGNIVEQKTLNVIENDKIKVNYHDLLDSKEKARTEERKEWKTIENIKELKTGYLSQAVHEITELALKYNGIIVMEDLNLGFKRGREKVEKQVYQKFEKMLIDKLNYLVDKKEDKNKPGGLMKAYQLTGEFKSFAKLGKESGIIFYIPAWNTSKIDPTTGFTNLFGRATVYENVEKSIGFWNLFEEISLDNDLDVFKFAFDYNDFTSRAGKSKTKWEVYSYGTRIRTFRNKEKNNLWDNVELDLTDEFKKLFDEYEININCGNFKNQIIQTREKDFHVRLMNLFRLLLQMRNSVTGTDIDYMISPVKNKRNEFFDSRILNSNLPENADANGAYNIAKKGMWLVEQIQETEDKELMKIKFNIKNEEWLEFAQMHTL